MTTGKRIFDFCYALCLGFLILPFFTLILIAMLILDGLPLFYVAERMKTPTQSFLLWKLRTMRPDENDSGVSGGNKQSRITSTGRLLRRFRLDEIPQLWNIVKGDMSFVGPRPPLRRYVEQFPQLYEKVLENRPGITGLATLFYHRHEERLLITCRTAAETEQVYVARCVPAKAKLDMIYQKNQTFCFDIQLMLLTISKVFKRTN